MTGIGTGAASKLGKFGKAVFAWDAAGNTASFGRGAYGVYEAGGLTFENGFELIGGGAGLLGNLADAKAFGGLFRSMDDLAGGKVADDIAEGVAGVGKQADEIGCFLPGTLVHQLIPVQDVKGCTIGHVVATPLHTPSEDSDARLWLLTAVISAAAGSMTLKNRKKKKPDSGPVPAIS